MASAQDLIRHWESMKTDRAMWDAMWQEIADYIVPNKAGVIAPLVPGQKTTSKIYDSTAIYSHRDLSAWIHSNLTSAAMEWFSLKMGGTDVEDPEIQRWLDAATKVEYDELSRSNFYQEIHECWNDICTFCTSAVLIDEVKDETGFKGLLYRALYPGEYAIEEGDDGRVICLFRVFDIASQVAVDRWPTTVSDDIRRDAEKNPSSKQQILHATFPRTWFSGNKKSPWPFVSVYIDIKGKATLQKGGYHEFPFAVARWDKTSGEKYGRGPGWVALPDTKTLNTLVRLTLKSAAKSVDPPIQALDNMFVGPLKLSAGGVNIVRQLDALKAMDFGGKWDVTNLKVEDLRTSIKRCFHSDQIQLLPPPSETTGKMTAYEVSVRYELMQRLLGPAFAHITSEFLTPIIERSFGLLFRAGRIPKAPQSLLTALQSKSGRVNVEYEGPLARAQRSQDIEAINKTLMFIQPITAVDTTPLDVINLDRSTRMVARLNGVPEDLIRDDDAVKEIRDGRAKATEAQARLEQVATAAKAARDMTPFMQNAKPEQLESIGKALGSGGVLPEEGIV